MRFDGAERSGFAGDTLASAMLAGGLRTVAHWLEHHRPRGVFPAGVEVPIALVHLWSGARREPNAVASVTAAFDDLTAKPQDAWPNLGSDVGAANGLRSTLLGAGFCYETFIVPFRAAWFWTICVTFIRGAAGMDAASWKAISMPTRSGPESATSGWSAAG